MYTIVSKVLKTQCFSNFAFWSTCQWGGGYNPPSLPWLRYCLSSISPSFVVMEVDNEVISFAQIIACFSLLRTFGLFEDFWNNPGICEERIKYFSFLVETIEGASESFGPTSCLFWSFLTVFGILDLRNCVFGLWTCKRFGVSISSFKVTFGVSVIESSFDANVEAVLSSMKRSMSCWCLVSIFFLASGSFGWPLRFLQMTKVTN